MTGKAERDGTLRVLVSSPQETEELGFLLGQILPPGTFLFIRRVGHREDPFYPRAQPGFGL